MPSIWQLSTDNIYRLSFMCFLPDYITRSLQAYLYLIFNYNHKVKLFQLVSSLICIQIQILLICGWLTILTGFLLSHRCFMLSDIFGLSLLFLNWLLYFDMISQWDNISSPPYPKRFSLKQLLYWKKINIFPGIPKIIVTTICPPIVIFSNS